MGLEIEGQVAPDALGPLGPAGGLAVAEDEDEPARREAEVLREDLPQGDVRDRVGDEQDAVRLAVDDGPVEVEQRVVARGDVADGPAGVAEALLDGADSARGRPSRA